MAATNQLASCVSAATFHGGSFHASPSYGIQVSPGTMVNPRLLSVTRNSVARYRKMPVSNCGMDPLGESGTVWANSTANVRHHSDPATLRPNEMVPVRHGPRAYQELECLVVIVVIVCAAG